MKGKFGILLLVGFGVLSTIAAATGNFALRLEQVARQTQPAATQAVAQTSTIAVPGLVLTSGPATGYRQFQTRSNVIAPGTSFNIYFEANNLTTRFESGAVKASMSVDILVRNEAGQTVAVRDNAWQLPISRPSAAPANLTQVYGDLTLNGLTFAPGRYQIALRIHDDFSGRFVDRQLDVELRNTTPVAAGPRLSSTQATTRQ